MKNVASLILILSIAVSLKAQTVSPVITSDCKRVCKGEMHIINNGLRPLFVTLESKSFEVKNISGQATPMFRNLDSDVKLELSEQSARLSPKEDHSFGFRMECQHYPCLVQIFATMATGSTSNGVLVRVSLPHAIYACDTGGKGTCRDRVRLAAGISK